MIAVTWPPAARRWNEEIIYSNQFKITNLVIVSDAVICHPST